MLNVCFPTPLFPVTSVGLRELGKLDSLQELHLRNNSAVDDDVLAVIGRGCKKLRWVWNVSSGFLNFKGKIVVPAL